MDLSTSRQLIFGFYEVEGSGRNQWRWTAPTFAVALRPPASKSAQPVRPARLSLELYLPPNEIDQLGPITVHAATSEYELGATTYDKAGAYVFEAEVPARALCTNVLPITFAFNKYLHGSSADARDLGAVVTSISLQSE